MTVAVNINEQQFIKMVNSIVKKSFGILYRGNNCISYSTYGSDLVKVDHLNVIARPTLLGDPAMCAGVKGTLNSDGTIVRVLPKYLPEARKYAQFYRQTFGEEVTIKLVDSLNGAFAV